MNNQDLEPLSAILAEMRADECIPHHIDWAFRIEAAAERERAEWHSETEAAKDARNRVACRMRSEFAEKCRNCTERAPGSAAALREALKSILAIEGYGAPWIEAKCIAQKALEGAQCTPPIAKETTKIEQPGNAAAMRDALHQISLAIWSKIDPECNDDCCAPMRALARLADAALAAPARNCDRFADAESARQAWLDDAENWDEFGSPKLKLHEWLFAPATEKGESNGSK